MADLALNKFLDSESRKQQVEVVQRAINKNVHPIKISNVWYAPARLADLRRTLSVDYSTFKKTPKERGDIATLKKAYLKEMRAKDPNFVKRKSTKKEYLTINHKDIW